MSTETQEAEHNGVPHERYTATKRACYGKQQDVADAWADGKYPTHNGGVLYSSPNFTGYQFKNGTGRLMHYSTREAIRTRNGLILSNGQCWSAGFAHCSTPKNTDGTVPLSAVESEMDSEHNAYDITRVDTTSKGTIVEIDNGAYGFAIGRDNSIKNGSRNFIFRLTPEEIAVITPGMFRELLLPDEVATSTKKIVDSREYTKTRLNEHEQQRHEAAGGKLTETERKYGEPRMLNRQYFRADLQKYAIVRQGEWFFIPVREWDMDFSITEGVPRECASCAGTSFDVTFTETVCNECGHVHALIESDPDRRLGNHRPRDSVYVNGDTYVRGMVKHSNGDHHGINLGERWHKAVTHDRDVRIFGNGRNRSMRGD